MYNRIIYSLLILISVPAIVSAQSNVFKIAGQTIKQGEKRSFYISISSGTKDSTAIPVTVIHGKQRGPAIGIFAGIHGYEYPPIIALQNLSKEINAQQVKGTVVLFHLVNEKAFFGRTVYYNPLDGKNLNRQFPGKKDGTITESIAWYLSNNILPQLNYVIDVHAGDASEDLHDYVTYYEAGKQSERAKLMAQAMNFSWIIRSPYSLAAGETSTYFSKEAVSRDIPTIAIECGGLGRVEKGETERINRGLLNVLRSVGIVAGEVLPFNPAVEITKRATIVSEVTGIFYSDLKSGEPVRKGMKIGRITDLLGNDLKEIVCPVDGFVVYKLATPPVNTGEVLFSLAEQ